MFKSKILVKYLQVKFKYKLYFIVAINIFIGSAFHPLHVAVTSIDYIESKDEFKVSIKLFKDDFKIIIDSKYGIDTDIINCNLTETDNIYIEKYIEEHFSMKFDNKNNLKKTSYFPVECNDDSIWISFTIENKGLKKEVEIKNTLMNDLYDDQKNLVIFKYKNIEKGFQFNRKTTLVEFTL
jgi:hypothetical protein